LSPGTPVKSENDNNNIKQVQNKNIANGLHVYVPISQQFYVQLGRNMNNHIKIFISDS